MDQSMPNNPGLEPDHNLLGGDASAVQIHGGLQALQSLPGNKGLGRWHVRAILQCLGQEVLIDGGRNLIVLDDGTKDSLQLHPFRWLRKSSLASSYKLPAMRFLCRKSGRSVSRQRTGSSSLVLRPHTGRVEGWQLTCATSTQVAQAADPMQSSTPASSRSLKAFRRSSLTVALL